MENLSIISYINTIYQRITERHTSTAKALQVNAISIQCWSQQHRMLMPIPSDAIPKNIRCRDQRHQTRLCTPPGAPPHGPGGIKAGKHGQFWQHHVQTSIKIRVKYAEKVRWIIDLKRLFLFRNKSFMFL